ncbi:MAG: InlB B-repeat-containing protein [Synergistaceae bacterium]|jgi:uncharacterized repeat protein (TIGR02543 family)|nr:InlB B-repeat-containing protein [Synergistaceae bacterium]
MFKFCNKMHLKQASARAIFIFLFSILTSLSINNQALAGNWQDKVSESSSFDLGDGDPDSPYLISTAEQLALMASWVNEGKGSEKYYKVISSIDLDGNEWTPIGSSEPFKGGFDGGRFPIYNMRISNPENKNAAGLFGYLDGGSISNVRLLSVNVMGGTNVGGLVGRVANTDSNVSNCEVRGRVSGNSSVGGLAGYNMGTIENSLAVVEVKVNSSGSAGGFVGNNSGSILNCVSAGDVEGETPVGGLVGQNSSGADSLKIENCASFGRVTGVKYVGGLVGSNTNKIVGCFAGGSVTGRDSTGGLVGINYPEGTVTDSVASGRVIALSGASELIGGVIGKDKGSVSSCFFDSQSTGLPNGIGGNDEQSDTVGLDTWKMTDGSDPGFAESGRWKLSPAGCYPQPTALCESGNVSIRSASELASVALFFEADEQSKPVGSSFKVPRRTAAQEDILWSSDDNLAVFYAAPGDDDYWHVLWSKPGDVSLTAAAGGLAKRFSLEAGEITESPSGWKDAGSGSVTVSRPVVSFNAHGGAPEPAEMTVAWEGRVTKPEEDPKRPGYNFGGWFLGETCEQVWNFDTDTVGEDITLHAKWIEPLGRPKNLTALPGDGQVVLRWDIPDGCEESEIMRYEVTFGDFAESKREVDSRTVSCVVDGLKNGMEYTLKVRAVDASGPGLSAEVKAIPLPPQPMPSPPLPPMPSPPLPPQTEGGGGVGDVNMNQDDDSDAGDVGSDAWESDKNSGDDETGADTDSGGTSDEGSGSDPSDQSPAPPPASGPGELPDSDVSVTIGGSSYGALKQADGSYLIVLSAGSSSASVSVGMNLPPGATVAPDISFPIDFSNGPVTFVITSPDGRTTTMRIEVEIAQRHDAKGEIVNEDGSLWTLTAIRGGDASYQTLITAPLTADGVVSADAYVSWLSEVIAETGTNCGDLPYVHDDGDASPDLRPRLLRISGKASNRESLESISISGMSFLRADEPGLRFEQEFETPVTYESIGVKHIIDGPETGAGGCSAGLIRVSALVCLLFAGMAVMRIRM